jgi:exosome complex RNA-binding protein Csl4
MAVVIPAALLDELCELAGPLIERARLAAAQYVLVTEDATEDDIEQTEAVQAVVLAVQAVLLKMPFNELGVVTALASVCGTVLAQCQSNRSFLYDAMKLQMARTMADVSSAREPMGHA